MNTSSKAASPRNTASCTAATRPSRLPARGFLAFSAKATILRLLLPAVRRMPPRRRNRGRPRARRTMENSPRRKRVSWAKYLVSLAAGTRSPRTDRSRRSSKRGAPSPAASVFRHNDIRPDIQRVPAVIRSTLRFLALARLALTRSLLFALLLDFSFADGALAQQSPDSAQSPSDSANQTTRAATPRELALTRGDIQMARKDYTEAVAQYQLALQINAKDAAALNKLGIAYQQLGQLDKAEHSYRLALSADRKLSSASNNWGTLDYQRGRYGKAIKHYTRALASDPKQPVVYSNLGYAYYGNKQYPEAMAAFRQSARARPGCVRAQRRRRLRPSVAHRPGPRVIQLFAGEILRQGRRCRTRGALSEAVPRLRLQGIPLRGKRSRICLGDQRSRACRKC